MDEDRRFNTRLDQQISLWLFKQEQIRQIEGRKDERRVSMEYVRDYS